MTRNTPEFDQRIADWLETDPTTAPPEVLSTVVAALPAIQQARRGLLAPWRFPVMNGTMRIASAAIVAVVAVVGVAYLLGPGGPGGVQSASPTPSESPAPSEDLLDTSAWSTFTSARYGFSVRYPAAYVAVPSEAQWQIPDAPGYMFDGFRGGGPAAWLNGSSMLLPERTTPDDWYDEYRRDVVEDAQPWEPEACFTPREEWASTTVDGHPADLRVGCGALEAFVFLDGRVYVFGSYSYNTTSPLTSTPGASEELQAQFALWLSTIALDPASAVAD
jgi:hypothetical protein